MKPTFEIILSKASGGFATLMKIGRYKGMALPEWADTPRLAAKNGLIATIVACKQGHGGKRILADAEKMLADLNASEAEQNKANPLVRIEADGTRVVRKNNRVYRIAPGAMPVGKYAPFHSRADMMRGRKDQRKTKWFAEAVREGRKNPRPAETAARRWQRISLQRSLRMFPNTTADSWTWDARAQGWVQDPSVDQRPAGQRPRRPNPGAYSERDLIDHAAYSEKVRGMTDAQLRYVINDARAAIRAHPEGRKAGYYADEINYCSSELHRRRTGKNPPMLKIKLKRGRKTKTVCVRSFNAAVARDARKGRKVTSSSSVASMAYGRRNPGRSAEAVELRLFIDNDYDLYRRQTTPIQQNLSRRWVKGTYDHAKAPKLWMYLVESGAKKYSKDHSTGNDWNIMFPKSVRAAVAQEMADDFRVELEAGNLTLPPKRASTAKANKYYVVGSVGEIIAKLSSKKAAMKLARTHGGSVLMNNPKRTKRGHRGSRKKNRYSFIRKYGSKYLPGRNPAYGARANYKKIDIYVNGRYAASTNQAKSCKEAVRKFKADPMVATIGGFQNRGGNKVTAHYASR